MCKDMPGLPAMWRIHSNAYVRTMYVLLVFCPIVRDVVQFPLIQSPKLSLSRCDAMHDSRPLACGRTSDDARILGLGISMRVCSFPIPSCPLPSEMHNNEGGEMTVTRSSLFPSPQRPSPQTPDVGSAGVTTQPHAAPWVLMAERVYILSPDRATGRQGDRGTGGRIGFWSLCPGFLRPESCALMIARADFW